MKALRIILGIGVVAAVLKPRYAVSAETNTPPVRSSIPYVATRNDAVQDMLWMANVGKDDVVYDLGSGDGRIVIAAVRDFGARRAVGIEIDPKLVRQSREKAQKAGVTDRVEFIPGDLFTNDFRQASVVALFLGHAPNIKLRPKMLGMLKPGTRIVSHQFGMGEWQPDKSLTVRTAYLGMYSEPALPFRDNPHVPGYTGNESHFGTSDRISMWVVPARFAGIWRGKIETAAGPQDCQLILHQRLSEVTGTFQAAGQTNLTGSLHLDAWGDHVRFECNPNRQFELRFDGHVREDTMQGTLSAYDQPREHAWKAQRDKADFTGTWEWPCASGPRAVRLRIEKRDGHLTATYLDRDRSMPVTDFYDCGGGFYFTLMINSVENGRGWLIGEGVLDKSVINGTIEFHPYENIRPVPAGKKAPQPVIQDWMPRFIKPAAAIGNERESTFPVDLQSQPFTRMSC